ncbi:hypothetical protein J3A83DRAFT_4397713 [Scleroderma citrinum]
MESQTIMPCNFGVWCLGGMQVASEGVGGMPRTIPHEVHTGTLPYWEGSHGTSVLEGIPYEGSHRTQLSHVKVHMGHGHPWKFWHTSLYRAQNTVELIPTIDIEQQLGNLFAPLQNT